MSAPAVTAVTIAVTRQHLDEGKRGDCMACPVALAIMDAFPGADFVLVGDKYIWVREGWSCVILTTPGDVRPLITAIDRGKHVEPFTFIVSYPAVTP